jgi:hypothetical protein
MGSRNRLHRPHYMQQYYEKDGWIAAYLMTDYRGWSRSVN